MTIERARPLATRIEAAVAELQELIRDRYPSAVFSVAPGEDPEGTYVTAIVDLDDPDAVVDVVVDRLLSLQVDEGLSVYVVPVRTPERTMAMLRARATRRPGAAASSP